MNKNVCIILLIFLIVYLIYKISSNKCDCFSVGLVNCNPYLTNPRQLCPGNIPCPDCDSNVCPCPPPPSLEKISCNPYLTNPRQLCPGNIPCPDCDSNVCPCPPTPSLEKISLIPTNPRQFLKRINEAYKNPDSNGVFISVNLDGMDGSGSVMHKPKYTDTYLEKSCIFGFIWDTDWLTTKLVDCLFSNNAVTVDFNNTNCKSPNFCEFANTSGSNTPDRCSQGLYNFYSASKSIPDLPYPTSCNQNKIYNLDTMQRDNFKDNKNCFTYIDHEINDKLYGEWSPYDFNEGVFLKDLKKSINYYEGIKKLTELNKPLPSALLFVYNDNADCITNKNYNHILRKLKSNFTDDTIVIKAKYDISISSFDKVIQLNEMPGYDKV
jgi:hypothetical protein